MVRLTAGQGPHGGKRCCGLEVTYFKIVQELSERHLLPVGLHALDLKAIPQSPVDFIVLQAETAKSECWWSREAQQLKL